MEEQNILERVRYWEGQLLASGDLDSQMRTVAELRRLHNRGLHSAQGIAIGLEAGGIAEGELEITCGLAYDCLGREMVVAESRKIPVPSPSIAAPALLILTYNPAGDPSFTWVTQGQVASGGVAVARILPDPGGAKSDPDFQPLIARPMARPRLAVGQTVPGNTSWTEWTEGGIDIGLQTRVDTSAAGFTSTPNYFADVIAGRPSADFFPAWFVSVARPSASGFTVRLFTRRFTRGALAVLDPKIRVTETPVPGRVVKVAAGNLFGKYDLVSRLLPIPARASNVTTLASGVATLDASLGELSGATEVAFGHPPRVTGVTQVGNPKSLFSVFLDTIDNVQVSSIVGKLGAAFSTARPTTIVSIDDEDRVELAHPIAGLADGDGLGVAGTPSLVTGVGADFVTVADASLFGDQDIVVRVNGQVEDFPPAKIESIAGSKLTLSGLTVAQIAALNGQTIASLAPAGTVVAVASEAGAVTIKVDEPKLFKAGDMVMKLLAGGGSSEPVRVVSVRSTPKEIKLKTGIAGLVTNDRIAAADFRVRATVLSVSGGGSVITVANANVFPAHSFIVRLNNQHVPLAGTSVTPGTGNALTLTPPIPSLAAGDVVALCSTPVTVTVQNVNPGGSIQVDPGGLIQAGDFVGALPVRSGIAIVAESAGSLLRLASPIQGLTAGDELSVVTVSGVVDVTPGTSATKVKPEPGHRIRVGDFLAFIAGWREPALTRSIAYVDSAAATALELFSSLDGLMAGDILGLANLVAPAPWIELKLKELGNLTPGNEVLLIGLDRLSGQMASLPAVVSSVLADLKLAFVTPVAAGGAFSIRPEDLTASVLLFGDDQLNLFRSQNIYVSWLACQDPEPMPRPCPDGAEPDCPCGKAAHA